MSGSTPGVGGGKPSTALPSTAPASGPIQTSTPTASTGAPPPTEEGDSFKATGGTGYTPSAGTGVELAQADPSLKGQVDENRRITGREMRKPPADKLAAFGKTHGLDPAQLKKLEAFAKKNKVPEAKLLQVGANDRYKGAEKLAAMNSYAITYDAAHNGKLSKERAQLFKEHVLPNFENGKVGVRLEDKPGAAAQYFGKNTSTLKGYEPNTMYLPKAGIDIDSGKQRGLVVHESQHMAQDSAKQGRTMMESEKQGYSAYAEYRLRDSGALTDKPPGAVLNFAKFDKLQLEEYGHDPVNRSEILNQFADAADQNHRAGLGRYNDALQSEGAGAGALIRSFGAKPFEQGYVDYRQQSRRESGKPPMTDDQMRKSLSIQAPADGL